MKISRYIEDDVILDEQEEQEVNKLIERVDKQVGWFSNKEYYARCAIYLANNLPCGILKAMDVYRGVHK